MSGRRNTAERVIERLATRSHGVVTRGQLLEAGLSEAQVDHRLARGALLRVHRGVYRAGHRAPNVEARYLAAVLACGPGAVLSGPAAAFALGLRGRSAPPPQVTAPAQRVVGGVATRRARRIESDEVTSWRGIPVTSVARTLVDLAAWLDEAELARACHEAEVRHRTTPAQVEEVLGRRPNSPGAAKLRGVLHGDVKVTLSKLERSFLERLAAERLPLPETNTLAGARRVDCRWPRRRLTVELDGYRYHHSRHAWEQDRRREREARARGDEFRRYSYGDVCERPRLMIAELRALLGEAPRAGSHG